MRPPRTSTSESAGNGSASFSFTEAYPRNGSIEELAQTIPDYTEAGLLCHGCIVEHGSPEDLRQPIPAVEVALIRSANLAEVKAVAQRRGLTVRPQENGVAICVGFRKP